MMKSYKIIAVGANSLFCNFENRSIFITAFQIREFRNVTNKKPKLINIFSTLPAIIVERRKRNTIHNSNKK